MQVHYTKKNILSLFCFIAMPLRHKHIDYFIFVTDSLGSEHSIGKSPQNHQSHGAEFRTEPKHASSETTAQFKSFLGEEGYHAPPLSSNLSASEIKQQLFDFSLGRN